MQYASALDVLDEVDALVGQLTRPAYLRQRASVVWAVGDGPRALALLDEAGSGPETLRARARILATIGRLDAAEALLTDQAPPPRGCERARFLTLLGAIQARRRAGDAAGPLEAALLELDVHCRELAVGLHLDLADAAARRGDEDAATRHMAALFEATPRPPSAAALRAASIDAALALARGDAVEAARVWQRRTPGRSVDARWRHAMGLAEAWAAQGRAQDAIRALRDAESALDDALLPVPLGAARLSDQGDHHRSAALLVELLTRSGDADAAADAGRLAVERTARLARRAVRLSALRAPDLRRWAAAVGRMQQDRGVATVALELLEPPLPGDR